MEQENIPIIVTPAEDDTPVLATPAEDVGFGDLPPTPADAEGSTVTETDVMDILANLSSGAQSSFPDPTDTIFGGDDQLPGSELLNLLDVEEAPPQNQRPVAAGVTQDSEITHGTFTMPLSEEGQDYVVTEVLTDTEHVEEVEVSVDVTTDHEDAPAEDLDYTVEEAVTEGRRTQVSSRSVVCDRSLIFHLGTGSHVVSCCA